MTEAQGPQEPESTSYEQSQEEADNNASYEQAPAENKSQEAQPAGLFQPPVGYVLVPEAVYEMLINQSKAPALAPAKPEKTPLLLSVLAQMHLGDIKTNIGPGDQISYIPRESITIRGRIFNDLDSFLSIWNKQDPDSNRFQQSFNPIFSLDNPEDYTIYHPHPYRGPQNQPVAALQDVSVAQRISQEEQQVPGAAQIPTIQQAPTPTQAQINAVANQGQQYVPAPSASSQAYQGPGAQQQPQAVAQPQVALPPRGSQARKDMIVSAGANPRPNQRIAGGIEIAQPVAGGMVVESPDQFKVHGVHGQHQVPMMIPGPPAEAAEVIEMRQGAGGKPVPVHGQAAMSDARTPRNMGNIR